MSYQATLHHLESMLESFLDRVVQQKQDRLRVIGGINRLDDIARAPQRGRDLTDRVGQWFAEHNQYLDQQALRPAEHRRIGRILTEIRRELEPSETSAPAVNKIATEIDRWLNTSVTTQPKAAPKSTAPIILKRGSEHTAPPRPTPQPEPREPQRQPEQPHAGDSLERFEATLYRIMDVFKDAAGNKRHLMSALEDSLKSATIGGSRDALILSATIIYYLKQHGYKVEPFVRRLKEAERRQKGERHA